jgi:hypothetical protein
VEKLSASTTRARNPNSRVRRVLGNFDVERDFLHHLLYSSLVLLVQHNHNTIQSTDRTNLHARWSLKCLFSASVSSKKVRLVLWPLIDLSPTLSIQTLVSVFFCHNTMKDKRVIEDKILEGMQRLQEDLSGKAKRVAADLGVPYHSLLRRMNGTQAKYGRPGVNRKLTDDQEAAIIRTKQTASDTLEAVFWQRRL